MYVLVNGGVFAELYLKWMTDEDLKIAELVRVNAWFATWLNDLEETHRQHSLGMVPESVLEMRFLNFARLHGSSYARKHYERCKSLLAPAFCEWLDTRLEGI